MSHTGAVLNGSLIHLFLPMDKKTLINMMILDLVSDFDSLSLHQSVWGISCLLTLVGCLLMFGLHAHI